MYPNLKRRAIVGRASGTSGRFSRASEKSYSRQVFRLQYSPGCPYLRRAIRSTPFFTSEVGGRACACLALPLSTSILNLLLHPCLEESHVKRTALLLCICATILFCAWLSPAFAQGQRPTLKPYTVVIPAKDFSWEAARAAANNPTTSGLQIWSRNVAASKDGTTYPIVMVGQDPSTSTVTTSIQTVIIP